MLCDCHGVEDFSANRQNALSNFYLANDDVFSCNFITLVKDEFRSRSAADATYKLELIQVHFSVLMYLDNEILTNQYSGNLLNDGRKTIT